MPKLRFNIGNLLVIILVLGIGFAALRESSDLWECGTFSVTVGVLFISILLAVHRTESRRAFWIGFAVFGWIYSGLALVPSIESRLMTTKVLAYLDSKIPGRSPKVFTFQITDTGSGSPGNQAQSIAVTANGNQLAISGPGQLTLWDAATGGLLGNQSGTTENFIRIGNTLFVSIIGWVGGLLSRRLRQSSRSPESATAVNLEGPSP